MSSQVELSSNALAAELVRAVESRGAGCTVVQMKHKGNNIYPDRRLGEVIHQVCYYIFQSIFSLCSV